MNEIIKIMITKSIKLENIKNLKIKSQKEIKFLDKTNHVQNSSFFIFKYILSLFLI